MTRLSTNGSPDTHTLTLRPGHRLLVRAPATRIRLGTVAPGAGVRLRSAKAVAAGGPDLEGEIEDAVSSNGLVPYGEVEIGDVKAAAGRGGRVRLSTAGTEEDHVSFELPDLPKGYGALAMVSNGAYVTWYAPVPPPLSSAATPPPARFLISTRTLRARPASQKLALADKLRRIVRFFTFRWVKDLVGAGWKKVAAWIAKKLEKHFKKEGLKPFVLGAPSRPATPAELAALKGGRTLLLVHGIFSSLDGCFGKLPPPLFAHLQGLYGDRIVGWDHWTVAKRPIENAVDLLAALPPQLDLDIVCHSRGALVVRAALEHPRLRTARTSVITSVRSAVFVAGANQGSALAVPARWNTLFNVFLAAASIPGLGTTPIAGLMRLLVGLLKLVAQGVLAMDSLKDLAPGSPFLDELNAPGSFPVERRFVARANFDEAGTLGKYFLDLGVDALFGGAPNDLVVPFDGALRFDPDLGTPMPVEHLDFGDDVRGQGFVFHTNFFGRGEVDALLRSALA